MFIIYDINGKPVKTADREPDIRVPHYCIEFPDAETYESAWKHRVHIGEAIFRLGGIEINGALPAKQDFVVSCVRNMLSRVAA